MGIDAQGKGPLMSLTTPDELAGFGAIQLGDRWVFADNIHLTSIQRKRCADHTLRVQAATVLA
jgi:hypothetical protein